MSIPMSDLQQMVASTYKQSPTRKIGNFVLFRNTPTLNFFLYGNQIIVAVRGTDKSNADDLRADALAIVGQLDRSERYQRDQHLVREVQSVYPKSKYNYIGVGHSLGGAILDNFLRAGLITSALSYNPLPQPQDLRGNPYHRRIYHSGDFIYQSIGKHIPGIEVRNSNDGFWKSLSKYINPFHSLWDSVDKHSIDTFIGGYSRPLG
jgi:hypothetical protein